MNPQPPRASFPAGAVTSVAGNDQQSPPDGSSPLAGGASRPGASTGPAPRSGSGWPWPGGSAPHGAAQSHRRPAGSAASGLSLARIRRRPMLMWGGGAGLLLVVGLILVLVLLSTGELGSGHGPFSGNAGAPPDVRPPLARLCPPPSAFAEPAPSNPRPTVAPAPSGPRTVDPEAGISYPAYGPPWLPWPYVWRMGTLGVPYGVGQHFVTETYAGGSYHASILSAAVPATINDGMTIDIECTGRQVAADVRAEYYPQPNTMELMRDEVTTLAGMKAWVTKFRLRFDEEGLRAKDELVGLAVIDVGRPTAAVLYVSIPGTHRQWDYVVDEVLDSVGPA